MVGDIKHIVIFQSLQDADEKTGLLLYENHIRCQIDYYSGGVKTHKFHDIKSASELIELLKAYQTKAKDLTGGIVLHFEMHGNTDHLACADGSFVVWEELAGLLRPINVATGNNLYLTMATCYGRYVYKKIIDLCSTVNTGVEGNLSVAEAFKQEEHLYESIGSIKKSACQGVISSSKEVSSGEIEVYFERLFEKIIKYGNVGTALWDTLAEKIEEDGNTKEELLKLQAKDPQKAWSPEELVLTLIKDKYSFYYQDIRMIAECATQSIARKLRNDPLLRMSVGTPEMTEQERDHLIERVIKYNQAVLNHIFDFA
jgi:hypothetical protein